MCAQAVFPRDIVSGWAFFWSRALLDVKDYNVKRVWYVYTVRRKEKERESTFIVLQ